MLDFQRAYPTLEQRMELAVSLSRRNAEQGGGPFGACVFDMSSHRLLSVGVNQVASAGLSVAHAEMMALMQAQNALQSWTLNARDLPACELVTSSEPCVQCYGGIYWSGIKQLACGARKSDVVAIGFDEGPRPDNWVELLERRGIAVKRSVMREDAVAVLEAYKRNNGLIYNP